MRNLTATLCLTNAVLLVTTGCQATRNGQGTYTSANGDKYVGEFNSSLKRL